MNLIDNTVADRSALEQLRVGGHEASDALCVSLSALLTNKSCALRRVEFDENRSGVDGLIAVASAMTRNQSLVCVFLCLSLIILNCMCILQTL